MRLLRITAFACLAYVMFAPVPTSADSEYAGVGFACDVRYFKCTVDVLEGVLNCQSASKTTGCYVINQENPPHPSCTSFVTASSPGTAPGCEWGYHADCDEVSNGYAVVSDSWSCSSYQSGG